MSYIKVYQGTKARAINRYVDNLDSNAFINNNSFIQFKEHKKLNNDFIINKKDYNHVLKDGYDVSLTTGIKYGSNIIVIDLDNYKWKDTKNHIWIKTFGKDYIKKFDTYTQSTPAGGIHLFFKYNEYIHKSTTSQKYEIDIRSNGGVIAMAGSFSTKHRNYYKVLHNTSIKPLPDNVKDFILKYIYLKDEKQKITKISNVNQINNNNNSFITEYNYFISENIFENYILDKLPIKYFNEYENWIKLMTCMKYLNLKELCKKIKMKHRVSSSKWADDHFFNTQWNNIKKTDLKIVEYFLKLVRKKTYLNLFQFKNAPSNTVKPNIKYNIEKISNKLTHEYIRNLDKSIVLKSDTGTGKSYMMRQYFKNYSSPFISIVSRVILGKEQYEQYIEDDINVSFYKNTYFSMGMNYIVQIDSLLNKLSNNLSVSSGKLPSSLDNEYYIDTNIHLNHYVIFIDEINSLLIHILTSDTVKNKLDTLNLLVYILSNCQKFILVDADISDLVFKFLSYIPNKQYEFIQNDYIHNKNIEVVEIFDQKEIIDLIKKEEKYLVCTDSRTQAEYIYNELNDKEIDLITSQTNINKPFNECKKCIISPKIIYGNDSTLNRPVFAIYDELTISPESFKQQIARERKITKLYIYMRRKRMQEPKFKNYNECYEFTKNKIAFSKEIFKNNSYNEQVENMFIDLLTYHEYKNDCYNTNKNIHFKKHLINNGFKFTQEVSKTNKIKNKDIKKIVYKYREDLYNPNSEEIIDFVDEYLNCNNTLKIRKLIKPLFVQNKWKEVFNIIKWYKIDKLYKEKDNFEDNTEEDFKLLKSLKNDMKDFKKFININNKEQFLKSKLAFDKINYLNNYNIENINNIYYKIYNIELFKSLTNFDSDEFECPKKLSKEHYDYFINILKYVFNSPKLTTHYSYPMNKDKNNMFLYNMIRTVFPSIYTRTQIKENGHKKYKYGYSDNAESILKIIENIIV